MPNCQLRLYASDYALWEAGEDHRGILGAAELEKALAESAGEGAQAASAALSRVPDKSSSKVEEPIGRVVASPTRRGSGPSCALPAHMLE